MKVLQPGLCDGLLQIVVFKFRNLAAAGANHVMVSLVLIRAFILGSVAKLVLDYQSGIHEQDNGIVESGTADAELLLFCHIAVQHVDVEMSFYRIYGIEYGIPFGRLPMSVLLQIFRKHLPIQRPKITFFA